ncbi:hypothetical protein [Acinetobacter baumannii]|uniref:hypothetical protein n=1 Tax=Acinetobacter baumannii TaxID=470 RepID=UPI003D0ED224|nr:hypothetical protein [Acinetobacter baumannii]
MAKITVKELFEILNEDLKDLIVFNVKTNEKGNSYPVFSSNKKRELDEYLISYMKDAGHHQISDLAELMEYVIIFSHELAHCLNKHSTYRPEEKIESVVMEGLADIMAGRIATAFYTYGTNLKKVIAEKYNIDGLNLRDRNTFCILMGKALSKLYFEFYKENNSKGYPPPAQRVALNITGITSFFYRSPQYQDIRGDYTAINIKLTVSLDSSILTDLSETCPKDKSVDDFMKKIHELHLKIQGSDEEINDIKSPRFKHIFGTKYIHATQKQKEVQKVLLKQEMLSYAKIKGITDLIDETFF